MARSTRKYTPRPGTKCEIIVGMLEKGGPVKKIHKALNRYAKGEVHSSILCGGTIFPQTA